MSLRVLSTGIRFGLARGLRPRVVLLAAAVVAVSAAVALTEKRVELVGSATRSLQGSAFGFLIPLSAFGAIGAVLDGRTLEIATTPLARFGMSRRWLALGLVLAAVGFASSMAAAIASVTALLAHDPWAPPLAHDVIASGWIGALVGCAYAGVFALGSTFGSRGGGRGLVLILDFLFGGTAGLLGVMAPRAHAFNLLGAPPPVPEMSQGASGAALIFMALLGCTLAIFRCAR